MQYCPHFLDIRNNSSFSGSKHQWKKLSLSAAKRCMVMCPLHPRFPWNVQARTYGYGFGFRMHQRWNRIFVLPKLKLLDSVQESWLKFHKSMKQKNIDKFKCAIFMYLPLALSTIFEPGAVMLKSGVSRSKEPCLQSCVAAPGRCKKIERWILSQRSGTTSMKQIQYWIEKIEWLE